MRTPPPCRAKEDEEKESVASRVRAKGSRWNHDSKRDPLQRRIGELLDGSEKGVQIDVDDGFGQISRGLELMNDLVALDLESRDVGSFE